MQQQTVFKSGGSANLRFCFSKFLINAKVELFWSSWTGQTEENPDWAITF